MSEARWAQQAGSVDSSVRRVDGSLGVAPRPRSVERRRARREWERGINLPVFLAHGRGEIVEEPQRSIKAPAISPQSTPPRPRATISPEQALRPVRRVVSRQEAQRPTMRVPSRTLPWQMTDIQAPYEVLNINGARITVVDMSTLGPLAGFSNRLNGLSPKTDNLIRTSLEKEVDKGLLFGARILRLRAGAAGESPILAMDNDGPNETRKVGVWRTKISRQRRTYIVVRSTYGEIGDVNRKLGYAGYTEPPPGSFR